MRHSAPYGARKPHHADNPEGTMRNNSHFSRAGAFTCDCCGRRTRHTGVQSVGSQTCPQCYDLAGYQNSVWDGDPIADIAPVRDELLAAAVKAGGNEAKIRSEFRDLFAV